MNSVTVQTTQGSAAIPLKIPALADIEALQTHLAAETQPIIPTSHHFAGGIYARGVMIPKGTLVVGKVHKKLHFCQVVSGKAIVWDTENSAVLEAPSMFVSQVGVKRVVYALEDTLFMTFHRTDHTDVEEVEKEMIEHDPTALFNAYNELKALAPALLASAPLAITEAA